MSQNQNNLQGLLGSSAALFLQHLTRTGLVLVSIILLGACASSPLPPWNPAPFPSPGQTRQNVPAPSSPLPARVITEPPVGTGVVTPAVVLPSAPRPAQPALPYGAAVAARFPEPSVTYSTPGLQTGRSTFTSNSETQAWMREQVRQATSGNLRAALLPLGISQRGESLEALVLTRAPATDAAALLAGGLPTVMLIGGQQQGDEAAGSEALLVIARELAQGKLRPLLDRINVIIVARANPDSALPGARPTDRALDLTRDHLLLNTLEAQALAKFSRDYRPTVVVDAHEYSVVGRYLEKFGAVQKFDALLQYATTANLPEFLTRAAEEWYRRPLISALKAQDLSAEWYYTASTQPEDQTVSMGGVQPDIGRNVHGLKNRISLLIQTRGSGLGRLHIQRRVHTQVTALSSVLSSTAQRSAELVQLVPYLEREVTALACKNEVVIEAAPTPAQYELLMLDPVTGADKPVTVDWNSSLALRKLKSRMRPCGYWLAADAESSVNRLRLHGVQVMRVGEAGSMLGETYRETSRMTTTSTNTTARQDPRSPVADDPNLVRVEVALVRGVIDTPQGSYYVPLSQALGNLIVAALEPDTQSSYFANGLLSDLKNAARVMAEPVVRLDELP